MTSIPRDDRFLALLVAAAFFMENLDATILSTALPFMAADFGVRPVQLSVGISAYLFALAVFIPASGWLAERFGPRRLFSGAILVFTAASAACSMTVSLPQFVLARVVQGLGGAMMVPVGRAIVLRRTPKHELVNAIALLTWPALVAPILGPPAGGWITMHWGWHWIFLINVPLGALGFLAGLRLIHEGPERRTPFDGLGFLLSGCGLFALMFGLDQLGDLRDGTSALWLAAGTGLLACAAVHFRKTPAPLIDLSSLRIPTFRATAVGGSLARIAISSMPFLAPLMFQLGFGFDAVTSGGLLLALFAGNLTMKAFTTPIMRRFGLRRVLLGNGVLVVVGFVLCGLLTAATPTWAIMAVLFFGGLTRSMQFTAINTVGFCDIPSERMGGASSLFSLLQQVNNGMGIAFGAIALTAAELVSSGAQHIPTPEDFRLAFFFVAGLAALALLDSLTLPRQAGDAVIRPARKG